VHITTLKLKLKLTIMEEATIDTAELGEAIVKKN
jgi:hypothetical protein